ncbi:MAG: vanadium-dependent haloperoxidase, partial [Acidobacteriota bacterium]|nr:vanadium-dependent haloperoxidase [Acidobacteriota bacterium]
ATGASTAASRSARAFRVRYDAALGHRDRPALPHPANGDEERYPNRIGSYSKGLPHDAWGEVDEAAYGGLLRAATSGSWDDFEAIRMGGVVKLTNPQAGFAFDMEGADTQYLAIPPAPALSSAEEAGEAVELYWMALLRDVHFLDYGESPDVAAALADINRLQDFRGTRRHGAVTAQTLFRDPLPGTSRGPYISQFLWRPAPFGAEVIDRLIHSPVSGLDHLVSYSDWLDAQSGIEPIKPPRLEPGRRYIRNGRDLAGWVHADILFQAYFIACLILGAPPDPGDMATHGGIGCPYNPSNPYLASRNQVGFATFGLPYIKSTLCEVASRALKATWYQKWLVHRRLRPEAFGGVVHNQVTANRYPGLLHGDLLGSPALARVFSRHGTYLLPQAFPEGCPTHPSYSAGHATVAGACVTVLKAMFDESFVIRAPLVPSPDGVSLLPYTGPELTVGGELNKLASNIATGRNIAGVHWRSDATESLKLGEAIAMSILADHTACFDERFAGFSFTDFAGRRVTV